MTYFKYKNKDIYYKEYSNCGEPLILLHGNTASSVMFELLLPLYTPYFKVILIDFLGNGKSERVDDFAKEMWYDQALQTIALIEHLGYEKVNLLGTSGGAYTALNAALERPDLIKKVIADSFDGRDFHQGWMSGLIRDRVQAVHDPQASQFYAWCQGDDWKDIVEKDTMALVRYVKENVPIYHHPLKNLQVPYLMVGSVEDQLLRNDLEEEYHRMADEVGHGMIEMYPHGEHPMVLSNAEAFALSAKAFFQS